MSIKAPLMTLRLCWLIAIIMGIALWTGHLFHLAPLHMAMGSIAVLALWVIAFQAKRRGVTGGLIWVAIVWGLVELVFGGAQVQILTGSMHWLTQVVHLLLGIGVIGLGEALAGRAKRLSVN
ncbi:hypothetical protein [Mangrovitalea sediminis]|uniref:hypothetical protein n=1 Tax=Mangrovitalea sediminis TaxID=1982043 RepID=UPI000BE4EE38|nr:hypothetical protein [Mangrovitalea sediminis]